MNEIKMLLAQELPKPPPAKPDDRPPHEHSKILRCGHSWCPDHSSWECHSHRNSAFPCGLEMGHCGRHLLGVESAAIPVWQHPGRCGCDPCRAIRGRGTRW